MEAIRANQAMLRNKVASEATKDEGALLFAQHQELRQLAQQVYGLLRNGEVEAAAQVYQDEVMSLRRTIAGQSYSVSGQIRDQIGGLARSARVAQ